MLDVLSLRNLMYVDGLFEYMARVKREKLQATRVSDTDSSLDFKARGLSLPKLPPPPFAPARAPPPAPTS